MLNEKFRLKDGRTVNIRRLYIEDYKTDNNYEFVHNWLNRVNKYLALEFEREDLESNRASFEMLISNKEEYIIVGVIFNEKIIGQASLQLNSKSIKLAHIGTWGIALHPDFQNQGLGKRLLQIIEREAKEKGLKKLEAEFFKENTIARKLYTEKMSYEIEGTRKYGGLLNDGTYTDRILIAKIIDNNLKSLKS